MRKRHSWIIWYAILLHYSWGALLLLDTQAAGVTAIATFSKILPDIRAEGVLYIIVSTLALWGLVRERRRYLPKVWDLWLLVPQQIVLTLSAFGAVAAIWQSTFADGVVRPRAFIAADQMPSILAAICHTGSIWRLIADILPVTKPDPTDT